MASWRKSVANTKPVDVVTIEVKAGGSVIAVFTAPLRTFASGKKGYGAYGKTMLADGTALQASINLVIPHSEKA